MYEFWITGGTLHVEGRSSLIYTVEEKFGSYRHFWCLYTYFPRCRCTLRVKSWGILSGQLSNFQVISDTVNIIRKNRTETHSCRLTFVLFFTIYWIKITKKRKLTRRFGMITSSYSIPMPSSELEIDVVRAPRITISLVVPLMAVLWFSTMTMLGLLL